jgi:soluble lytic murein transglycosylase-like protein
MRFCFCMIAGSLLATALSAASLEGLPDRTTWVVRADRRTGHLVRTVLAPRLAASGLARRVAVSAVVDEAARQNELDPLLVHSVIQAESGYNPFAVSPKGAQGLMQLMPSTARRFGVANSFNMTENVQGGVRYLRYLMDLFQDEKLAVAAYNAGEEAVIRHGGVPPYRETENYVRTVTRSRANAKKETIASAAVKREEAAPPEPEHRPLEAFLDAQGNMHLRTR